VTEDANAAYDYAGCQRRNDAKTSLYDSMRQSIIDWAAAHNLTTKEIKQ